MNSIIKLNDEVKERKDLTNIMSSNDTIEIQILNLKSLITKLYSKKKQYNEIIQNELLINNLTENKNNFFNIFYNVTHNNKHRKNNNTIKYFSKFVRNINYINKYCFENERRINDIKYNFSEKYNISNYWFVIDSIFLLKNCINANKHLFIKKYFKLLLLFQFLNKISLNVCKLILEIYINIIRDLIIINNNSVSFLDDLIGGMIDFLNKSQNGDKNILYFILSLIVECFLNDYRLKSYLQKSTIFLKLLNYKSSEDKYDNDIMIINFLSNIYKNNITTNILYNEIYKNGILDLNYYSNSISLLHSIINEEYSDKRDNINFRIRQGFYIKKNNPLIQNRIKFKQRDFTIIFSFRLINTDDDNDNEIILFKFFENPLRGKNDIFLSFVLTKKEDKYQIKILNDKNEKIIENLLILKEKDYLVCISITQNLEKNMALYINSINSDLIPINDNTKNNEQNNKIKYDKYVIQFQNRHQVEMNIELGKKNFDGIIGDFFILNKNLTEEEISNVFSLNGYYPYIAENIEAKTDLINQFDNFYLIKKDLINYFQKKNYYCSLKILSETINYDYGTIKYKEQEKIETFVSNDTLSMFIFGNGIDFLVFQLHNLFSIFDKKEINSNELYIFNLFLYQTLNLYYDAILIMNNYRNNKVRLNENDKFDYFFLSFLIIVHFYKNKNKYLKMNLEIFNLLLDFAIFCDDNNYQVQRNLIINILLDEDLFAQNEVIKESKILENLDFFIAHISREEECFDDQIFFKILNLQFILQSKVYDHKLYMKIIIALIFTKKESIIDNIFNYIINIKNEIILYHYLKAIFLNFQRLKSIIETKKIKKKIRKFLQQYFKNIDYAHCKYCVKILYLFYLLEDDLKLISDKDNIKDFSPIEKMKYKAYKIKCDFINIFDIDPEEKLKFIKNSEYKHKDNESIKNKINADSSKIINKLNEKKFFNKFNSIIKSLHKIYETQNSSNQEKDIQKNIILNILEMLKLFFIGMINNRKNDKNKEKNIFLCLFDKSVRNNMQIFFKIFLLIDYSNAINILEQLIELSITKVKYPFYFSFIEEEEIFEVKNYDDELKIKNDIMKIIIIKMYEIHKFEKIINENREKLLIILYKKLLEKYSFPNYLEKFIIAFIINLPKNREFQSNYFFLIDGEYYNFLELQINVLFEFLKIHNYECQYINIINGFILSNKKFSIFYTNEIKMLKNNKNNNENSTDIENITKDENRICISNILNILYFLIYFLSIKNKENKDNKDLNSSINEIIEIIFNNCKDIFEYIKNKKLIKKYTLKTNIPKFEIYIFLYDFFISKVKKSFTLSELEKIYKQKISEIKDNNKTNNHNRGYTVFKSNKIINEEIINDLNKRSLSISINNFTNNSIQKENINNNNEINIDDINNNISEKNNWNLKSLLKNDDKIPKIYYYKLIASKQSYLTKLLSNPKAEFFWKIFFYSLKDKIFYNKNFIKLSKSFKAFSKNYNLELSSIEENAYHLNYPTKIKNFICKDYYRPFLKPDINFFNNDLIIISHNYISSKTFEKAKKEFDITKIKFIRLILINQEKDPSIICENIFGDGSIFGKLYLKDSFLFFINDYESIIQKSKNDLLYFIYSFQDVNKIKNKIKTKIIYYKDIKEIIIRRFLLKRIGYEIFLKDGHSYLFNFLNFDNLNKFQNIISKKGVLIINDPVKEFEKKEYKNKYKKGEFSNFQYLLLLNKYGTRTYNDINQYLVFPLLYINYESNIKRDLSKAICLNKEKQNLELDKYIENYKVLGYYFNNHYSSSAHILYYLVRIIPYTYMHINFQSGKFDVPERIFNNYNGYTSGIAGSSENREFIPELFYFYEVCLNLNYNNIGKISYCSDLINNFNSNKFKTTIEFIINQRINLEKENIVPWINNIFGYNQVNESKEVMNIFPITSYEQYFNINIERIKEKLKDKSISEIYHYIRLKLAILDIGISPVQLFKTAHPEKNIINKNDIYIIRNGSSKSVSSHNSNNNTYVNKKSKDHDKKMIEILSTIKNFTLNQKATKYKLFLNDNNMNIYFVFNNKIIIHNIYKISKSKEYEVQVDYPVTLTLRNNLINLELDFSDSFKNNIILELMSGFYCICRNDNKTLKFINFNQQYVFSFLWSSVITAIEPFNYLIEEKFFELDYIWKIYFGDEDGFLCLCEICYEHIYKNNEIKFSKIKILKKIKIHDNCINNIIYHQRLSIIFTSSLNGDIGINNAESFEILNMIKIGNNYLIDNIKISLYDLIYVGCYNYKNKNNYIKCYTLNGIKVTKMKTEKKIINFFINNSINIFYEDKTIDKFYLYDLKKNIKKRDFEDTSNIEKLEIDDELDITTDKIIHCSYCKKLKKILIIYDNNILALKKLI